jgi:hypothetical protein
MGSVGFMFTMLGEIDQDGIKNKIMTQIILSILVTAVSVLLVLVLTNMITNYKNYKYYKLTYDVIINYYYVKVNSGFNIETYRTLSNNAILSKKEVLFFFENNKVDSIKLLSDGQNYIHTSFIMFDPYALYWFWKIKRARNKNNDLHVQESWFQKEYVYNIESFKFLRG